MSTSTLVHNIRSMMNVKWVTISSDNNCPNLQISLSFCSMFWFYGLEPCCVISLSPFSPVLVFGCSCFNWKSCDNPTVVYLINTGPQTETVSDQLEFIIKHLATTGKESLCWDQSWWKLKGELKEVFFGQKQFQTNSNFTYWCINRKDCWEYVCMGLTAYCATPKW